jgi:hypothetical protein
MWCERWQNFIRPCIQWLPSCYLGYCQAHWC